MRKSVTSRLSAAHGGRARRRLDRLPGTAEASGCSNWHLPLKTTIKPSSNVPVTLADAGGSWRASHGRMVSTEVIFDATRHAAHVHFIITWSNHTAGVHDGVIDDDGFVTGFTYDRFKPRSRATWTMGRLARCVR